MWRLPKCVEFTNVWRLPKHVEITQVCEDYTGVDLLRDCDSQCLGNYRTRDCNLIMTMTHRCPVKMTHLMSIFDVQLR